MLLGDERVELRMEERSGENGHKDQDSDADLKAFASQYVKALGRWSFRVSRLVTVQ